MDPVSLPDQSNTPISAADRPSCHGPYQLQPTEDFLAPARRTAMLHAALDGVVLGTWDQRILAWLCHWSDTATFLAILGWVERARTRLWTCPDCGFCFDACHQDDTPEGGYSCPACAEVRLRQDLERARGTARLLLDHLGPHLDQPPAGLPGWIYDPAGYHTRPELPADA